MAEADGLKHALEGDVVEDRTDAPMMAAARGQKAAAAGQLGGNRLKSVKRRWPLRNRVHTLGKWRAV
jgi:hypothetical protein